MRPRSRPILLRVPDPGWLFLGAGLAMLASAVLIPASEALSEARYARDRALVSEEHRVARLDKHRAYLDALHERQPALIAQLKAIQLNQYPEGMRPLGELDIDQGLASASIFGMLEPALPEMPAEPGHRTERSTLAKLATGEPSRRRSRPAGPSSSTSRVARSRSRPTSYCSTRAARTGTPRSRRRGTSPRCAPSSRPSFAARA